MRAQRDARQAHDNDLSARARCAAHSDDAALRSRHAAEYLISRRMPLTRRYAECKDAPRAPCAAQTPRAATIVYAPVLLSRSARARCLMPPDARVRARMSMTRVRRLTTYAHHDNAIKITARHNHIDG